MGFYLDKYYNEINDAMKGVDGVLAAACPFDSKTDELLRFALSIKARSAPCVRKHFKGAKREGASDEEIANNPRARSARLRIGRVHCYRLCICRS